MDQCTECGRYIEAGMEGSHAPGCSRGPGGPEGAKRFGTELAYIESFDPNDWNAHDPNEAFLAGTRSAKANTLEILRKGKTPKWLSEAGFDPIPSPLEREAKTMLELLEDVVGAYDDPNNEVEFAIDEIRGFLKREARQRLAR